MLLEICFFSLCGCIQLRQQMTQLNLNLQINYYLTEIFYKVSCPVAYDLYKYISGLGLNNYFMN